MKTTNIRFSNPAEVGFRLKLSASFTVCAVMDSTTLSVLSVFFQGLFSESDVLLLGFVSLSDKEVSGMYFKTSHEHNCRAITAPNNGFASLCTS